MPACIYCHRETPPTRVITVIESENDHGSLYYFCSWLHLLQWLDEKFGTKSRDARIKMAKE